MAASLRIKIGASVDSSVASSFTSIEKAAKKARAAIVAELNAAAKEGGRALKPAGDAAEGMARQTQGAAKRTEVALGQMATGADVKFKQLAASLKALPADLNVVAREAQRALAKMQTDQARAALGLGGGGGGGRGHSLYWWKGNGNFAIKKPVLHSLDMDPVRGAASFGMGAASYAARVASNLATGIGVDTDFASMMSHVTAQQKVAQQISNSGYMPGQDGANGQIVGSRALMQQARAVGNATGTDTGDVLGGLQAFVKKTGDLDLGRRSLEGMAKLARATGTSFEETADAAAEISNHLGDIPNKGEAVQSVMRQIAGQGKMGAVEISDMARQMAKIAATANSYEGGGAKNIAILGVLAQEAKLQGGATTASQAATSVASVATDLSKSTTMRNWRKYGISAFTDDSHRTLKSAPEIIKLAIQASGGDLQKLGELMPNKASARGLRGFANVYTEHGGGTAGLQAVDDEFKRLVSQQMRTEEVDRAFAESMKLSEAKVTIFNNKMQEVAEQFAGALLPAFEQLAPAVLGASEAVARFATSMFVGGATGDQRSAQELEADSIKHMSLLRSTSHRDARGNMVYDEKVVQMIKQDVERRGQLMPKLKQDVYADAGNVSDPTGLVAGARSGVGRGFGMVVNDVVNATEVGDASKSQLTADKGFYTRTLQQGDEQTRALQAIERYMAAMPKTPAKDPPRSDASGTAPANAPNPK